MKTHCLFRHTGLPRAGTIIHSNFPGGRSGRNGVALVLVLGFLALITALVVAFFSSTTTELLSTNSFANEANAKQLADSTVQLAMANVRQATATVDPANPATKLAWASQPGMIRTYDDNGNPHAYYKLYSSDQMVITSFTGFDPAGDIDSLWQSKPALFTDLNAPVISVTGTTYPIVDPSATGFVKGFTIKTVTGLNTSTAPMPTKWIYVLQDGQLTSPTGTGLTSSVADWAGSIITPTLGNPIVARIAFWTDDDTCKVNINTAAGDVWVDPPSTVGGTGNPGSYWDTPRTISTFDHDYMSRYQPARHEFQRYPGHPATTYLSAIFPNLTSTNIYQIAPRVAPGGSLSGMTIASGPIVTDSDRLYSSVDELLFGTTRSNNPDLRDTNPALSSTNLKLAQFFLTAHSRSPELNLFNQPRIVTWPVSSLTGTANRTPLDSLIAFCGTLNGSPYYFVRSDPNSPTTDLPATASSSGLGRNRALITYLRNLTSQPVPGFGGGTFLAKYPKDRDQILAEIFDYIRALNAQDKSTSSTFSSFTVTTGTSLTEVGKPGMGQIVPIIDDNHSDQNTTETLRGFGRFPTIRGASLVFAGVGQTSGTNKSIPPNATQAPSVPVADGKTRVQAFLALNLFDPSQGYASFFPNYNIRISKLDTWQWSDAAVSGGSNMGFASSVTVPIKAILSTHIGTPPNKCIGLNYGGYEGASASVAAVVSSSTTSPTPVVSSYIDLPTTTDTNITTFTFYGGEVKVEMLDPTGNTVLQTVTLSFPQGNFPVPRLAPVLHDNYVYGNGTFPIYSDYRDLTMYTSAPAPPPPATVGRFTGACNQVGSSGAIRTWFAGDYDVIRSVEANTDPRLIAAMQTVPSSNFDVVPSYYGTTKVVHSLFEAAYSAGLCKFKGGASGTFVPNSVDTSSPNDFPTPSGTTSDGLQPIVGSFSPTGSKAFPIAFGMQRGQLAPINGVYSGTNATAPNGGTLNQPPGDYDTGFANTNDGAYINKADEGTSPVSSAAPYPYYDNRQDFAGIGGTFFSPNRQMPSAAMFGSLPTGVHSKQPWQTLLFRPDPDGTQRHIGAQSPQDHLLLDLFTMPVVEPYAISDPFSTAGKINMNYQIVPFTYLLRDTGMRAVLKSEQMLVLSNTDANYKIGPFAKPRYPLDLDQTLVGFTNRFAANDIFRSASEICNIWLVPQVTPAQTYDSMQTYWSDKLRTGDNVRERPYVTIYPRLTTKSNTYTVYYRVQTLKKIKTSRQDQWTEGKDSVTSEYRGSSTFERYLDTGDTTIPDYATATNPAPIDNYYKFRIIETKKFAP